MTTKLVSIFTSLLIIWHLPLHGNSLCFEDTLGTLQSQCIDKVTINLLKNKTKTNFGKQVSNKEEIFLWLQTNTIIKNHCDNNTYKCTSQIQINNSFAY
jgi:hypothetical protein